MFTTADHFVMTLVIMYFNMRIMYEKVINFVTADYAGTNHVMCTEMKPLKELFFLVNVQQILKYHLKYFIFE